MKATVSFSRVVAGANEEMENLSFLEGDYYDIYHHMVMDKDFASDAERINRYGAFKVVLINKEGITLEKLAPPISAQQLKLNEKAEMDFGRYGIYTVSLQALNS